MKKSKPIERLKNAIDGRRLLEHYNVPNIRGWGSKIRGCCPIHGGDNPTAFSYDLNSHLWYCFTGCSCGGDVISFVMKIERCSFIEAVKILAKMYNVEIDFENEEIIEDTIQEETLEWLTRMRSRARKQKLPIYEYNGKLQKVIKYRNFSENCLDHYKIGVALSGELEGRIVLPIDDVNKRLVGMTGRRIKNTIPSKFMHRPYGYESGSNLASLGRNLEWVRSNMELVIVEGLFDCMRLWDYGIKNTATPIGTFTTDKHVELALRAGAFNIVLGFDNDKAGRNGIRKALEKFRYRAKISILNLPEGKDPCDCTYEEAWFAYNNRLQPHEWLNKYGKDKE